MSVKVMDSLNRTESIMLLKRIVRLYPKAIIVYRDRYIKLETETLIELARVVPYHSNIVMFLGLRQTRSVECHQMPKL